MPVGLALPVYRRVAVLAWACLCLWAAAAGAAELPVASGDVDGDGRIDLVTFDRRDPFTVRVWLSATGATAIIRARGPIVGVVARDLDADHRAELIASDQHAHVHVWTKTRQRDGFRKVRTHVPRRNGIDVSGRRAVDGAAPHRDAPLTNTGPSPVGLAPAPIARARAHTCVRAYRAAVLLPSVGELAGPLAPRPPPSVT